MKYVLSFVIICFFVLLCLELAIAILQGIAFIAFQKTGRIFFSPFVSGRSSISYLTLFRKKKAFDIAFAYTKFKGNYYFVGQKGIYKSSLMQLKEVSRANLNPDEDRLIEQLKIECYRRLLDDRDILDSYISTYGQINPNVTGDNL